MSTLQLLVLAVIALAVAISSLRMLPGGSGQPRSPHWPRIVMQIAAAVLLGLMLFPPGDEPPRHAVTVLTAGAEAMDPETWAGDRWIVALPETGPLPGLGDAIPRVPDLAGVLRDAPGLEQLRVIGHGLPPRDQQIDPGIAVEFLAAPHRPGLVELDHPATVAAGRPWSVRGRVAAIPGASIVLRDPADIELARVTGSADGEFSLVAPGTAPGRSSYRLELLDPAGNPVESLTVPVVVETGEPLRVALLSGAPNPELKYLRRWAVDAGLAVDSSIVLTRGAQLGAGPSRWDAANLAGYDLLVFDERAWAALSDAELETIEDAARDGLGVLLRLTGQPSTALRRRFADLGFMIDDADIARGVHLAGGAAVSVDPAGQEPGGMAEPVELSRRPLQVTGRNAVPLIREHRGDPLGLWRSLGQGRIGLLWLTDSHRLVLTGDEAGHAALWSDLFAVLARGRERSRPVWLTRHRWPDQRAVLCGLSTAAHVLGPDEEAVRLIPDPAAAGDRCAGFWPHRDGWHRLRHAGTEHAFHVYPTDAGAGLRAELDRAATMRLIAGRPVAAHTASAKPAAWQRSRWPWFAGWLVISGLLWWYERRLARQRPVA
jgi:hypothetical protein